VSNILAGGRVQLTVYEVGDMLTLAVEKIRQSESPVLRVAPQVGVCTLVVMFSFERTSSSSLQLPLAWLAANHRYHFA
jgi:hypothetical protein